VLFGEKFQRLIKLRIKGEKRRKIKLSYLLRICPINPYQLASTLSTLLSLDGRGGC